MPTFSNNAPATWWKRLLQIGQSGNDGVDGTARKIESGDGVSTSVSISKDHLQVRPEDNDGNATQIFTKSGSAIFTVDTTNSKVKVGSGQLHATQMYANFGTESNEAAGFLGNVHYPCPFNGKSISAVTSFGTGTNPDTSYTISSTAAEVANCIWYVPDAITIDGVYWWVGADLASGDTIRGHLVSYAIVNDNSSTSGDLSDGTVLADGDDITNAGREQVYFQNMTVQSSSVAAGRVIMFFFRGDSNNSNYSNNVVVKYHLN